MGFSQAIEDWGIDPYSIVIEPIITVSSYFHLSLISILKFIRKNAAEGRTKKGLRSDHVVFTWRSDFIPNHLHHRLEGFGWGFRLLWSGDHYWKKIIVFVLAIWRCIEIYLYKCIKSVFLSLLIFLCMLIFFESDESKKVLMICLIVYK